MRPCSPVVAASFSAVLLTSALPANAASAPSAASARAQATKLYEAGKYAAACPKFREAAKLAPDDPAIAADLGLCLMKIGERGAARDETLRAIRLARPGGTHADAKTRRNAFYNLSVLGEDVTPPKPGTCEALGKASDLVDTTCTIVLADACAGIVATACQDYSKRAEKVGRPQVSEVVLAKPSK